MNDQQPVASPPAVDCEGCGKPMLGHYPEDARQLCLACDEPVAGGEALRIGTAQPVAPAQPPAEGWTYHHDGTGWEPPADLVFHPDAPSVARRDTAQADTADPIAEIIRRKHRERQDIKGACVRCGIDEWPCLYYNSANEIDYLRAQLSAAQAERDLQKQNTMEALAESDEYSVELDRTVAALDKTLERESTAVKRADATEARLAAVLALCDEMTGFCCDAAPDWAADIRAALDQPDERPAKDGA